MPWTKADVERHKKGLSDEQKETWVEVANSALRRCLGKGGSQDECEGSAIRQANSVVGKQKELSMEYKGYTTSTNSVLISVTAIDVDGEAVPVAELMAAYLGQQNEDDDADLGEAVWTTAFVNDLPDSSFAVIMPGGEKDEKGKTKPRSLRKLPYKDVEGKVDIPHLRNALARLPQMKGVSAELKAKALKTLQAAAKKHLKTHQEEVDIERVRGLLQEALAMLDAPAELEEMQLSESAVGYAVTLAEAGETEDSPRTPLLLDFALMRPGRGNRKDNHYYPREVLERDAHVFEGVKMYATDHRPEEKSVRTEVGIVKACPVRFEADGTPIGRASIFNPDFAEQVRNRAKAGVLDSLENSILGIGKTQPGEAPDGEKANVVEAITKGISVDFVTKGGAGGQARALIESDTGGVEMDKEQIEKLLSESELPQEAQERLAGAEYEDEEAVKQAILKEQEKAQQQEAPQKLEEAEVAKLLSESSLPSASKKRLAGAEYEDESALREAVLAEVEYVKTLTGSGQPFGQGQSQAQREEKPLSERLDDVDRRHGLRVPETQEV